MTAVIGAMVLCVLSEFRVQCWPCDLNGPCEPLRRPNAIIPIWLRRIIRSLDRDGILKHSQTGINSEGGVSVQEFRPAAWTLAWRSSSWGLAGHGRVYVVRRLMECDPVDPFPPSSAPLPCPYPQNTNTRTGHHWRGRKPPCHMADRQLRSNLFPLVTANRSHCRPNLMSGIIWQRQIWHVREGKESGESRSHRLLAALRVRENSQEETVLPSFPLLECRSNECEPNWGFQLSDLKD